MTSQTIFPALRYRDADDAVGWRVMVGSHEEQEFLGGSPPDL